jgi:hypothetical protein
MSKVTEGCIRCYCLSNNGKLHCPLTTEREDLERTFNYQVRGEDIVWVDIDEKFVCTDKRTDSCKNCPFNK